MICPECKYENPAHHRFCGVCGAQLPIKKEQFPAIGKTASQEQSSSAETGAMPSAPAANESQVESALGRNSSAAAEPPVPWQASETRKGVAGPSFLGLDDRDNSDYLLEEEPPRSHTRRNLALVLLLLLAGLAVMEWRAARSGVSFSPMEALHLKLPKKKHSGQAANSGVPANPGNANDGTPQMIAEPVQSASAAATPSVSPTPAALQQNAASGKPPKKDLPVQASNIPPDTRDTEKSMPQSEGNTNSPREKAKSPAEPDPLLAGQAELQRGVAAGPTDLGRTWLWRATAKGNGNAPVLLAQMYLDGNGVQKNCEQAVLLLQTAARKNNARARSKLASLYTTGTCVPQDRVQAYRWLSSALEANPESDWLNQNRRSLWDQMTPGERQRARH